MVPGLKNKTKKVLFQVLSLYFNISSRSACHFPSEMHPVPVLPWSVTSKLFLFPFPSSRAAGRVSVFRDDSGRGVTGRLGEGG